MVLFNVKKLETFVIEKTNVRIVPTRLMKLSTSENETSIPDGGSGSRTTRVEVDAFREVFNSFSFRDRLKQASTDLWSTRKHVTWEGSLTCWSVIVS